MRFLLLFVGALLGLGLPLTAWAAQPPPIVISQLPVRGLSLEKGWRYFPTDSALYAQPSYNDARGKPVTLNLVQTPAILRPGVGWLRLRWQLGQALAGQRLLLLVDQAAATEIYLNGHLLYRLGTLSNDPARVLAYTQPQVPIELPPLPAGPQVLAVRLALPALALAVPNPSYLPPLFEARLLAANDLARQQQLHHSYLEADLVNTGALLLLGLLHLTFFYYNSVQRANLYFALFALSSALGQWLGDFIQPEFGLTLLNNKLAVLSSVYMLVSLLGFVWAIRALYELFRLPTGKSLRLLWLLAIATWVVRYLSVSFLAQLPLLVFIITAVAEPVRLTIKALRQQRRGAGFVAFGFAGGLLAALALLVVGGYQAARPLSGALDWLRSPAQLLTSLSPAIGISLFLAHEFALDARLLSQKLSEVERLSAQTLAQEQEKQALLAAQNETLERQVAARTAEVVAQRNSLEAALTELRATQDQLIQREKMASLGELTAGIAHEIQNPLNFVNNFAEVSTELLTELKAELAAGDPAEAQALADDLTQNLYKIAHHGQRAAGIVRGMLAHSRISTSERQSTDLNALADEYLRLAYHGLRAQDKAFNARLETDFAPGLPLVEVVTQDIGRVLLNLLTNAFYAVRQQQRTAAPGYQSTVWVSTQAVGEQVEVRVRDNGPGIPEAVRQKIFHPFFTTKPAGEGTGLGLSLAHDIVVQGHGGTLNVVSEPGEFTEFIVRLPVAGGREK